MHLENLCVKKLFFTIFILLIFQCRCSAQANRGNDTSYYVYFPESMTGRFYFSKKYTSFDIKSKAAKDLHYLPNTTLNTGIGVTWHNFSLNLAYGLGYINKDDDKGKTKYLDLQTHFFRPKWNTDVYGQFYKGYYLSSGFAAGPGKNYYYRPDVKITLIGFSRYYIFNSTRFSYRAAFLQNEWQKKSAGTFLIGVEAYYGVLNGDSALVPKSIEDKYSEKGIHRVDYLSIGPGAGYAYSLIIAQHIYFTGSFTGNLNVSYATESNYDVHPHNVSVNFVSRFKISAGYNSRTWNISANYIANDLPFKGANPNNKYSINTGKYRFVISKKFMPGKKLQKTLRPLNMFFKE